MEPQQCHKTELEVPNVPPQAPSATVSSKVEASPTIPEVCRPDSPVLPIAQSSPCRHKRRSENHSVNTIRSNTSEEERKRKPWGKDILVCTAYALEADEKLFALLDTASTRSWISFDALKMLGVSTEIGKDETGIQPVTNNGMETETIAGKVKAYGKIKLSYRCIAGPEATKRYKAWFRVTDHSDTPFQVILGQDFPALKVQIGDLSLVTLSHPKTKGTKIFSTRLNNADSSKHRNQMIFLELVTIRKEKSNSRPAKVIPTMATVARRVLIAGPRHAVMTSLRLNDRRPQPRLDESVEPQYTRVLCPRHPRSVENEYTTTSLPTLWQISASLFERYAI